MKKTVMVMLLALLAAPGIASATAYTDEALWRAAAITFAFENFDSIATGSDVTTLPALGIRFDALNDGTQPTVQPYSSTGGIVRSSPNNLLNDRDFSLPGRGPLSIRPLNAGDFIFGLGMWNVGGDDQLSLSFFNANGGLIEQVTSASGIGFFGIINATGATRAQVDFVQGNGYAPVDDFQTATRPTFEPGPVNPVPEPETYAMLLAGLGLMGFAARRRKQPTA
jgi:hypothetical protein